MKNYDVVLFDLDGTLLDTAPGIINAVRCALDKMDLPELPPATLRKFCGPPALSSYMEHCRVDEATARQCVTWMRDYQTRKALYEAAPYAGIPELLAQLKEAGYQLAVTTLKREDVAVKTLEAAGILQYFDTVAGVDMDESLTKADIIREALGRLSLTPADAVLIGDSIFDAQGAWSTAVTFIAVTYGYGFDSPETAAACSPMAAAESVGALAPLFDLAGHSERNSYALS